MTRTATLENWVPAGRRLLLVDIENMVGGSNVGAATVRTALQAVMVAAAATPCDVMFTACGPNTLKHSIHVLPHNLRVQRGIDGADRCLVELMHPDDVVGRYASVVLASADAAAFAEPVRLLSALGVPTDVIVGEGQIGTSLYMAARSVRHLPIGSAADVLGLVDAA